VIEFFTNADKDYGMRLAESLEKSSQMKDHSSSAAAEETVKKAEKMGHEADPY
jgi:catalase